MSIDAYRWRRKRFWGLILFFYPNYYKTKIIPGQLNISEWPFNCGSIHLQGKETVEILWRREAVNPESRHPVQKITINSFFIRITLRLQRKLFFKSYDPGTFTRQHRMLTSTFFTAVRSLTPPHWGLNIDGTPPHWWGHQSALFQWQHCGSLLAFPLPVCAMLSRGLHEANIKTYLDTYMS